MQRVEMEEVRQREANITALMAIGPRKKPRLDGEASSASGDGATVTGQLSQRQVRGGDGLSTLPLQFFLFYC